MRKKLSHTIYSAVSNRLQLNCHKLSSFSRFLSFSSSSSSSSLMSSSSSAASTATASSTATAMHSTYLHGLCSDCTVPCSVHPSPPSLLLSSIDFSSSLSSSIKHYRRHLVINQGQTHEKWPSKIVEMSPYASTLQQLLRDYSSSLSYSIQLSIGEELSLDEDGMAITTEEERETVGDIYLFPDQLNFKHVRRGDLELFLQTFLVPYPPHEIPLSHLSDHSSVFPVEPLKGIQIMICGHKLRDKRCGVIGPLIADQVNAVAQEQLPALISSLISSSSSSSSSSLSLPLPPLHPMLITHVGGHKYAGNVILYPSGTWYGRIIPCNTQRMLECHLEEFISTAIKASSDTGSPIGMTEEIQQIITERSKEAQKEMEVHVRGRMLQKGDAEPEKTEEKE